MFLKFRCVIIGTGILQLPYALSQVGWFGIVLILFASAANTYTGSLLMKCLYVNFEFDRKRLTGYPHAGFTAFGMSGKLLVEFMLHSLLLGIPIVYVILAGMNLNLLLGYFSVREWIIICGLLILIPFLLFRTLQEVAVFSAFGVFASMLCIFTVIWYGVLEITHPETENKEYKMIDLRQIPASLGSISFSYANFVFPEVESAMKEPKKFSRVLYFSMLLITVMYVTTAVIGYSAYASKAMSPILNNLPPGIVTSFTIWVITAHVLLACPVVVTSFALEMERKLNLELPPSGLNVKNAVKVSVLRISIIAFILLIAVSVPYFADIMELLGAFSNTMLLYILPILLDFKLYGWKDKTYSERMFGIAVLSVGVFVGVVGSSDAIFKLIKDVNK